MNIRIIGLVIFVVVQTANVLGLGVDATLSLNGLTTISDVVWSRTIQGYVVGWLILVMQLVGGVGLSLHFF